jgi:two-component system, cell cycle sensor histidine kinase and response regulator CckA
MATTGASVKLSASHEPQADQHALLLTHKSELIGELAQAMANQVNNVMMAVTSYAELELKKASGKEKRSLEQVLIHATRATFLIHKLLDFSRARVPLTQPLQLDEVLKEVRDFLQELLGEHIELAINLRAELKIVCADRVEIEQMLFALVVISRNAIAGNGKIMISTSIIDGEHTFANAGTAVPNELVVLGLESHPGNIEPSAHPSSLVQNDRGRLSLAGLREIVKDCHALTRFSIEPEICSFKLYFPVVTGHAIGEEGPMLPRHPAVARTVLLVEDDDAVRVPATEFLMMEGFKVLQARTGNEAINVVQQSRSPLDVLVTDLLMPNMNGREVAETLLNQHPDLKVLYISGDPGRGSSTNAGQTPILRKPFRLNVLRDKIHDLLGE